MWMLTNKDQEPVEVFAGLPEGTKVVPFHQPNEFLGFGSVNSPCQVHNRTALHTIIGKQLPQAYREKFADATVSALDWSEPHIEIILNVKGRICVPRAPKEGI